MCRIFTFWIAFAAEVQLIEVDVFLQEGKLLVAHELTEADENRPLQRLYLKPLKEIIKLGQIKNEIYTTIKRCNVRCLYYH